MVQKSKQQVDQNGHVFPSFITGATQKKAYTASAAAIDDAISSECSLVLVWCSTDAFILVGASPTADADDRPIAAKVDTPIVVKGGTDKISAIRQTGDGTLYVTELL